MPNGEVSRESFTRINVPGDGSCLFWAIALAYLTPVRHNNDAFRERFERLFGGDSAGLLQVQKLIQDHNLLSSDAEVYNADIFNDEILKKLVKEEFRRKVVYEMSLLQDEFKRSITIQDFLYSKNKDYVVSGKFQEKFRDEFSQYNIDINKLKPGIFDEDTARIIDSELDKIPDQDRVKKFKFGAYLECMRDPKAWGGNHEMQAMSRLLQCEIVTFSGNVRHSTGTEHDSGNQIQLFNDGELHYNFGLIKAQVLIESIKRVEWNEVKRYLGLGIDDINYQDSRGQTAFDLVNQHDDAEINQLLLNQGASAASTLTAVGVSGSRSADAVNRENTVEAPQDFELIQLLIQEADSLRTSTSTRQNGDFGSFQERFQSYIDQIPSYLHSVEKPGFFSHFFLGSFSTLLDTKIAEKLNIKKIYFSFDTSKTLKVVVVKNGQIGSAEDAINNINLFSISEGERGHQFTSGELEKILRENIDKSKIKDVENEIQNIKDEIQDRMKSRLVQISKEKNGVFVKTEVKEMLDSTTTSHEFHEIEKGLWNNPEGDIAKLAGSNKQTVKGSLKKVLEKINDVHFKYEDSLQYGSRAREAAHHGFLAGALNNFRYRYNLRAYLEQFAGRGYADIVLLVRGPNRALNSIPIIMEIKVATAQEIKRLKELKELEKSRKLTRGEEDERNKIKENIEARSAADLKQAKGYAKGFQPNVQRVLTTADDILYVVVNFDSPSPISSIKTRSREEKINPLFQDILKSADDWDTQGIGKRQLKKQIKDNLERIYHTFPGTGEKGDNHYFSRFLLGQSLLLDRVENLGTEFKKHIFIYDRDENIPTEIHPESGRPQRPAAQAAKAKLSTGLDKSHAAVSMVLIPGSTKKLVYVINIVEANRKDVLDKALPLNKLSKKIGEREIVELNLNFDTRYKSNFERYLTVEVSDPVSLEEYNERGVNKFQGAFKKIPYPDQLRETFDRALDSQLTSAQSSSINEYKELFKEIGKGIWPFRALIGKETNFQAVLHGVFSYYSDLKLQKSPETRALVLTEFQTGRGERIDMLVHGVKFEGNTRKYTPIGLELKASRQGKGAKALLKEADDQINGYKKGVTYKTLTDGEEVEFIGVVFNKGAEDANSLILTSKKSILVKAVHSSIINIAGRKRLEEAQEIIQRSNIRDTLESATAKEKYDYWLSDHDIRGIANVEYNNLYDVHTFSDDYENSARGLAVISDRHLNSNITQFKGIFHDNSDAISLRTFIINLGNNHWVTLVVSHQNGQYNGYYADSQDNNSIPDDIREVLEQARIIVHDVSVAQQTDGHNCGFWALENARDINTVLQGDSRSILGEIHNRLQVQGRDEAYFKDKRENVSNRLSIDSQRIANLETILAETQQPVGQCSKKRGKRNIGMACVDSRDEEDITKEEKERRIKELLSNEMTMKIKLKELESEINDEVLSRHEEIESAATYDVNKSDVLSNALQSLKLSKMLLLMSQKSEVSTELQEKAYYNTLVDIGALIHDHKNHVKGDHLNVLKSRVQGNQLFSVAHDLYYLSKSVGSVDQDKLYSDQVKSKISLEDENGLDDIYSEFSDTDIKGFFSDSDIKDFYTEAEAYDKEVITIHSTQVFADGAEVYVEVRDSNENYQKVVIGEIASIQNTENYILDEETSGIKLRVDGDKEYTITQELEEEHVKHYLNIPGGHKVKIGNIISSFTGNIKKAIHSKLHKLELLASKKDVEEISNAEITDQDYNSVIGEIKQSLLQKGVSEGAFNKLKDHLDSLGEKVFAEYISDVEKKLGGHGIEFDRNKFDSARVKGAKSGKLFSLMAIYDLFDSISDVSTLGRHDNDALKQIFGINGILDAMDDVRESLSASYIRSDGKVVTKIPRDSAIGKVISKIPDPIRKTFVKIINNPVVQSITFATIAYQFGYSINEIAKGNHHPLNYYWTASSGVKLASMSIRPISVVVSSSMKGISAATKGLGWLSTGSKVLGKVAGITMVSDFVLSLHQLLYSRTMEAQAIAEQIPMSFGDRANVFFSNYEKARYNSHIRVKGYLDAVKNNTISYFNFAPNVAAVVQYVFSIEERYSEIIKIIKKDFVCMGHSNSCLDYWVCELEKRYSSIFFDTINAPSNVKSDLYLLNISQTLNLKLYQLGEIGATRFKSEEYKRFLAEQEKKKVYLISEKVKHLPHITQDEYNDGLRFMMAPLRDLTQEHKCSDIINEKRIRRPYSLPNINEEFLECNADEVYRNCQETFILSGGEPFIFTNVTRSSLGSILYLSGPNQLTAAKDYPAVMYVPKGGVDYRGSTDHDNTFIINYDTYGLLTGGTESNNTVVMNYNASTISVVLHQYGYIIMDDSQPGIGLLDIHNYISHSTANQNITTDCKTRYVDAGEGGGNNSIQNYDVNCQDKDSEVRKVNKNDTHSRSKKRTTFIIDKSSGGIISSNNLESKKNLDTIFVKNIDIAQLKINEHQADYSLELLADDERGTVASTKIDSFKNLVIKVDHYGIEKTIIVQDKSLPDIIKDMEYQKLNHSGNGVGSEIAENSKKKSKAMILAEIKGLWDITPYEVAKDIINNSILGIPIYLARAEKVIGNVTHEGIVEGMYPVEVVADFGHNCKEVITIGVKSYESKCVVRFPQAHECDHLVDFTLRIGNLLPDTSMSYKIVDLTECNINPTDVECRKSSEDVIGIGITLNSYVNQRSFHIVLDNYLLSPRYQRVALRFNEGGEFYKINDASLKLEPILYNHEKKVELDYDSFIYYEPPNEQELQILRVYHNQPNDKNKIGFVDLKDKSIFDSNVEIIDGSLILLHNNTTFIEIKNWNTNRPTRKMMFAFNETTISDLECLFPTCDPEGIVEEFRKEVKKLINEKDEYGYTRLHYAAREGNLNLVALLLDSGADANAQDGSSSGKKSIHIAAENNHKDVIDLLIRKGVNVNDIDKKCWTPLHYTARKGHLKVARFLIEKGANVNAQDNGSHGRKPIHIAAENNHKDVIDLLIKKGVNVNDIDKKCWTPLCWTMKGDSIDTFKFLVRKGADVNIRDSSCLGGVLQGQAYRRRFLMQKQHRYNQLLLRAVRGGNLNRVKDLVDRGANVNNQKLLDAAVDQRDGRILKYLLEKIRESDEKSIQRGGRDYHDGCYQSRSSRKLLATDLSDQSEIAAKQGASKDLLQNDEIDYTKGGATSGASKPSSWIDAVKGVFQFISSPFKPAIGMEHSQPSKARITQSIDTNGTLLLLDVFIRKITGQKYISTVDQSMPLEAQGYALNIMTEFERVLKDTAKRSGVSVNESSFNYFKTYQAVEGKMISGKLSKIPTILYSAIEEAYPKNEKFLSILKSNIEKMLDGQQVVNNVHNGNQMQNTIGVNDKMPLSSLNSIAIEPLNGKKGVTCAGRVA